MKSILQLGLSIAIRCSFPGAVAENGKSAADTVYTNGKIYTVNEAQPWAEAIAMADATQGSAVARANVSNEVKAVVAAG
jgi:hypothetical protein